MDWEAKLEHAILGYMHSFSRSMGMTPSEYKFKRMQIFDLDKQYGYKNNFKQLKPSQIDKILNENKTKYKNEYVTDGKVV